MRLARISFILLLVAPAVLSFSKTQSPPRNTLQQKVVRQKEADLAEVLRRQGKDPEPYLEWGGNRRTFIPHKMEFVESQGQSYLLLGLDQWIRFTPGDFAERYILIDATGTVRDVATTVWSNRLRDRFSTSGWREGRLYLLEGKSQDWDNFEAPYVLLGVGHGEQKRFSLYWSGLSIQNGRFQVYRR